MGVKRFQMGNYGVFTSDFRQWRPFWMEFGIFLRLIRLVQGRYRSVVRLGPVSVIQVNYSLIHLSCLQVFKFFLALTAVMLMTRYA